MTSSDRERLREGVERLHGSPAAWVESVPVVETWRGETVWEGAVEVFGLEGHPQASLCYAWEHETESGGRRVVAVLHAHPVSSAGEAVRVAIASGQ